MYGFPQPYDNTGLTVELREIVESGVNIWDFDYPVPPVFILFNGKVCDVYFNKEAFEKKIIDHYYFRQIGQETVGRWLHYFRTRIREIMPYYVQLYEFDAKFRSIEDPLESYNLVETFKQEHANNGSVKGSGSSETSSERSEEASANGSNDLTRKFSNTPQGNISNLDSYITEATVENGSRNESSNQSGNESANASVSSSQTSEDSGSVEHTLTKRGNIGVQPLGSEVENIRNAFINIDQMVINELNDLFIQVY